MKRTWFLLFSAFFIYAVRSDAQGLWSVEISAGMGGSGALTSNKNGNEIGIGSSQFQLLLQYQIGKLIIGSGISYLKAGYENNNYNNLNGHAPAEFNEQLITKHLALPLRLGYELPLGAHFSLLPFVGPAVSYNINARLRMDGIGAYEKKYTGDIFDQSFNRYSLWALAGLQLSGKANERLYMLASLQAQGMVTGFQNNIQPGDHNLRLMAITGSLGLGYRF